MGEEKDLWEISWLILIVMYVLVLYKSTFVPIYMYRVWIFENSRTCSRFQGDNFQVEDQIPSAVRGHVYTQSLSSFLHAF